jgi:hypothetical protein
VRRFHSASQLLLALWVGALLCFMTLVAPSLFRAYAPDEAARVVRILLPKLELLSIAVTVLALGFSAPAKEPKVRTILVAVSLAIALLSFLWLTPKMAELRALANDQMSQLQKDNPLRKEFGMLHGVSSTFMLMQVLLGLAALFFGARGRQSPMPTET